MTMNDSDHRYDDIIHLQHPVSSTHPHMSLYDRAAQFSPFAALTGHEDAIRETARLTEEELELDEDMKAGLNEKLLLIQDNIGTDMSVTITYYVPDVRKPGGLYVSCTGNVKKMSEQERAITMADGTKIPIDRISGITIIS